MPVDRTTLTAVFIWSVVFLMLASAASQIAVGWDEGFTFDRLHLLDRWVSEAFRTGEFAKALQPDAVERNWRFSKEEPDGHGPFYCLLSWASYRLTSAFIDPPTCYRLGSVALFALAATSVFLTLRQRIGGIWAWLTLGMFAAIPRVVPETCFALIDGPLYSLAMLTWCAFVRAESVECGDGGGAMRERRLIPTLCFGLALGLAMATKVTGWLLIGPYAAWCVWNRRGWKTLVLGSCAAMAVCVAVNVGWWHDPLGGVIRFWRSNLTRAETIAIGIEFWGERHAFSLPWYNTLVWTVIANPLGMTAMGLFGVFTAIRRIRRDEFGCLLLLNWLLLVVVRALPNVPGHDGTRQIIISFGFLALLAGYGLAAVGGCLPGVDAGSVAWKRRLAAAIGLLCVAENISSSVRHHPLELSYYSPLIGGLPGAVQRGFEATYFWDALTPEVLDWINANTPASGWVLFRNNPTSFHYLRNWGRLRVEHAPQPGPPTWLVMQNRPGIFESADDWLIRNATPAYRKEFQGVWLIAIYPGEDFKRSRSVNSSPPPTVRGS